MLTLTQLPNKDISIKAHYLYRYRIHEIPGAYFNYDTKEWILPIGQLDALEKEFKGELVYKTPRWVIKNEPMPDMTHMYQFYNQDISVPAMKYSPYDYQNYGIKFMVDRVLHRGFVLNADDVGLGKTLMTIGTLKWFIENRDIRKIMIICKKSIKGQWIDEFKKFTDLDRDYTFIKTETTPKKRHKAYEEFSRSSRGILVTNYHVFLNDTDIISRMHIDFIVIDEVHSVKARQGILNNNIGSVTRGRPTIFLTGTPIMSKPEDIFGIIQMVDENYFGDWDAFSDRYLTMDYTYYEPKVAGAKNLDELRQKVQDIVIRRTEYEVSIQLPKVMIKQINCDMDPTQEKIMMKIQALQTEINDEIESLKESPADEDSRQRIEKLTALGKAYIAARQAAVTDPRMFFMTSSKLMKDSFAPLIPKQYKGSEKTNAVLDLVEDIIRSDDKVIIFSKFRMSAILIANDIEATLKEKTLLYTGGEDEEARDDAIRKFRDTTAYNILIGTEAMAEGLNLQHARYVINIDQPDTFAIKVQRIGRSRRAGSQFENIIVYDMITKSTGTIKSKDEERLENIQNNQNITDALITIDEAQRQALIDAMKYAG